MTKNIFFQCSWCKRWKTEENWVEDDIKNKYVDYIQVSHSICPDCKKKMIIELEKI